MTAPDRWVLALAIGGVVALIVTPLAARHAAGVRWRGGVPAISSATGLAAGLAACTPFLGGADTPLVMGVLAGLWLFVAGGLADRDALPRRLGHAPLLAGASVVVIGGLRLSVTGYEVGDALVTFAVVCAATAAWRSAETRDGLLAGWAVVTAAAAAALGGLAGQPAIAAMGAGLIGAALGFLAYWLPPTVARLRSGGAMLLGFLAVVLTLDAHPVLGAPRNTVVPVLLLALPLLDTALVTGAHLRGRRLDARVAGLAGRLRALGLGRGVTVGVLVAAQALLGGIAVFAGRGVLALGVALGLGGAIVGALVLASLAASLNAPRGRWSTRLLLVGAALLFAGTVLAVPAAVALVRAREVGTRAADEALAGLAAARRGDSATAARSFAQAEADFGEARRRLADPFVGGGLAVPVLAPNLRAARDLSVIGAEIAHAGHQLTTSADPQRLRIRDGTVPLDELRRLEPELAATADSLAIASERLRRLDRTFVVAPVEKAIGRLQGRLARVTDETKIAADAARLLPAVLGGDGSRRYFLAVQNNAEARATGGFIGSWGLITALNGHLSLDRFTRISVLNPATRADPRTLQAPADYRARYARFEPERTWQNVNVSPDVPTVSAIEANLLPQVGVGSIDGVVTVDPIGMAAVLRLTGPVTVLSWPGPITADNVVDVTLRQAYAVFEHDGQRRDDFLGDVADATWRAFTHRDLGNPARVLQELGRATHQRHLAVWLVDADAQRLVHSAHADAALPPIGTDLSLVTTQNAGANKLDLYLRRRVRYVVHLLPPIAGGRLATRARLEVTFTSTAPSAGLPEEVLGPNIPGIGPGVNRSFVTVYSALGFLRATLDGVPIGLEAQRELGYWADATYLDVGPGAARTLAVDLQGSLGVGSPGRYTLHLVRQPLEAADDVDVALDVPAGWRLSRSHGLRIQRGGRAGVLDARLDRDRVLSVQVERDPRSLWDRLRAGY